MGRISTRIRIADDPKAIRAVPIVQQINCDLEAEWLALAAGEKRAKLDSLVHYANAIGSLSIALGHDASKFDPDGPLPDIRYVELARTVGLTRAEFLRRVALPGALPGFFTGLRLAVTTCWTALVVLEQINTTEGVGYLMNRARDYGQTDVIVVGLVIYAILGLVSDLAIRLWERKALSYRKVLGS